MNSLPANTHRDLTNAAPATDSGYGSLSNGPLGISPKVPRPTVSGYASNTGKDTSVQIQETRPSLVDNDEISTLYSDSQSQASESVVQKYIMEFTEYLSNRIRQSADYYEIARVKDSIPDLLKEFSVKLGSEISNQEGRDAMYFVHKHRKYMP